MAVERFFAWADEVAKTLLQETPMALALKDASNQRVALKRFLEDGVFPSTTMAQREPCAREAVVGRRAWRLLGSDDGAFAKATLVTLLA